MYEISTIHFHHRFPSYCTKWILYASYAPQKKDTRSFMIKWGMADIVDSLLYWLFSGVCPSPLAKFPSMQVIGGVLLQPVTSYNNAENCKRFCVNTPTCLAVDFNTVSNCLAQGLGRGWQNEKLDIVCLSVWGRFLRAALRTTEGGPMSVRSLIFWWFTRNMQK